MNEYVEKNPVAKEYDHRDHESTYCPWTRWEKLRELGPIARTDKYDGVFLLSRYDVVVEALRDTDTFSNTQPNIPPKPVPKLPPVMFDPPEHRGYREIVNPFFTPARVAEYQPIIREIATRHVDRVLRQDSFNAATELAMRVTNDITLHFLGIVDPPEDFKGWVEELALQVGDVSPAAQKVMAFLSEEVEKRRAKPGTDVISAMINAKYDGQRPLTHEEITNMALLLTLAGFDTTASAMLGSIWYLVQNPDALEELANCDEKGWRLALDELVRWTSPIAVNSRVVRKDTEVHGCPMHKGDLTLLMYGSANRDPSEFAEPDKVVLDRFPNRHVGFGMGTHRCLGSHLAKSIMYHVLSRLLTGLGEYRLENPQDVVWATAASVRGIRSLPLVRAKR